MGRTNCNLNDGKVIRKDLEKTMMDANLIDNMKNFEVKKKTK